MAAWIHRVPGSQSQPVLDRRPPHLGITHGIERFEQVAQLLALVAAFKRGSVGVRAKVAADDGRSNDMGGFIKR